MTKPSSKKREFTAPNPVNNKAYTNDFHSDDSKDSTNESLISNEDTLSEHSSQSVLTNMSKDATITPHKVTVIYPPSFFYNSALRELDRAKQKEDVDLNPQGDINWDEWVNFNP